MTDAKAVPLTPEELAHIREWGIDYDWAAVERGEKVSDIVRIFATLDARDAEIARLSAIEQRAKELEILCKWSEDYEDEELRGEVDIWAIRAVMVDGLPAHEAQYAIIDHDEKGKP